MTQRSRTLVRQQLLVLISKCLLFAADSFLSRCIDDCMCAICSHQNYFAQLLDAPTPARLPICLTVLEADWFLISPMSDSLQIHCVLLRVFYFVQDPILKPKASRPPPLCCRRGHLLKPAPFAKTPVRKLPKLLQTSCRTLNLHKNLNFGLVLLSYF